MPLLEDIAEEPSLDYRAVGIDLMRRRTQKTTNRIRYCRACNSHTPRKGYFCLTCGRLNRTPEESQICLSCGGLRLEKREVVNCPRCGSKLRKSERDKLRDLKK